MITRLHCFCKLKDSPGPFPCGRAGSGHKTASKEEASLEGEGMRGRREGRGSKEQKVYAATEARCY